MGRDGESRVILLGVVASERGAAGNEPVITSDGGGSTATIATITGQTSVTTVVATGATPIVYSISGGADQALFSIDGSTGVLTYQAPASTGTHAVIVRATNDFGYDEQAITSQVGAVPVITSNGGGPTASVNVITGQTAVTTVTATGTASISFTKSGEMAALFNLNPSSGVLGFAAPALTGDTPVTVTATNTWGHDDQDITVHAGVVPVITSDGGGPTATIPVSSPSQAVTTVVATGTATIAYTKSGADAALFSIDNSSGVLAFLAPSVNGDYAVTVTATNTWGADSQDITVNVT